MARVRLFPSAERDLESIHEYTVEQWGEAQAERYIATLRSSCETLADFPASAPPIFKDSKVRMRASGEHRIVYRPSKDGIEIARFLHQEQKLTRSLLRFSER